MPLLILSVLLQVAFIVHIVRTGRNTTWIWIVLLIPVAGSIAYLIVELLPDLLGSRTARRIHTSISDTVNPHRDIRSAISELSATDTVENNWRLADEYLRKNMYEEARDLYHRCLTGIYASDPDLMYGLAKAEFGLGNLRRVRTLMDELITGNPDYRNAEAHLLYARTAEGLGDTARALHEYDAVVGYFPGPEAPYRYAMLLKTLGDEAKANALLGEIVATAKRSTKSYRARHGEWIVRAREAYER